MLATPIHAPDGIPVVVACRVLKLARQPYYCWLTRPIGQRELDQAYLANAVFDAHRDDPAWGISLSSPPSLGTSST